MRKYLCLALLPLALAAFTGCSGISASHSISPASFFLPGLIQVEPEKPVLPEDPENLPVLVAVHTPAH